MVENIECFGAKLDIPLAQNFEILQQGNVEICASWIVNRIPSAISKGQALRSDECCRIGQQGSETQQIVSRSGFPVVWISDTVSVRACPKVIRHSAVVRYAHPAGTPSIDNAKRRPCLKYGDSGKLPSSQEVA